MKNLFVCILTIASLSFGQSADFSSEGYGAGAAEYLKRPVFAQSAALGGAVVAWRENLTGTQYNPALYDSLPAGVFMVKGAYSFMTLDRKHSGAEAAGTIGNYIAYGLSFISYGVGNIPETDSVGNELGSFSDRENALTASVATRLLFNIAVGGSVRYLNTGLYTEHANGMGFDLGATWEPRDYICVGVSVQNILSRLWWSTGLTENVLTSARLGVNGMFLKKTITAEIDVLKTLRQPIDVGMGLQYTLMNIVSVRGGISIDADVMKFHSRYPDYSLGAGVRYSFFMVNYALIIPDSDLGLTHKMSIAVILKDIFK